MTDNFPIPEFVFTPQEVDQAMNAAINPVIDALSEHSKHEAILKVARIFHKNLGQELAAIYSTKLKLAALQHETSVHH